MNVGFIGLGRMGRAMAVNLGKAGHHVRAWNRTREVTAERDCTVLGRTAARRAGRE